LITVEEAKQILIENVFELTETISIETHNALGFTLAEDIYSPLDLPPFDQSNVDGYAVKSSNNENNSWKVISEIKAGDHATLELNEGEAIRIFTGAMVPENASCVIMQEKITRTENQIIIEETELKQGEHIRKKGSQIKAGELAIKKHTIINPSVIGFISTLGLKEIQVYKKPKIKLIITGNELQQPGTALIPGKVYESNSSSLTAAIATMGLHIETILFVKDEKKILTEVVNNAMINTDLLLISGGISVGDYDFVNEVLKENNTTTLFYKIAQKPGKPLFFGKNNHTFIFGLPGNPGSALTCFYEYVYPCVRKLQGRKNLFLTTLFLPTEQDITKKKGLANFLKAQVSSSGVLSLEGQESFKMKSFTDANAFIYLPLEKENSIIGDMVEVHLLPAI
jgi:molybdopterin molybdotransferase